MTRTWPIWLTVSCLLMASCASRTLPLPPPTVEALSVPDPDTGLVRVRGLAQEGASVGVINDVTLVGTIVTSDEMGCNRSCPFEAFVLADRGDPLRIWQFFETEGSLELTVPP